MIERLQAADDLVVQVAAVIRERDNLYRDLEAIRAEHMERIRDAYRRGYRAGWGARKRGGVRVTNPERHARGWVRRAMGDD